MSARTDPGRERVLLEWQAEPEVRARSFEEFWKHRPQIRSGKLFRTPDVNLFRQDGCLYMDVAMAGLKSEDIEVIATDKRVSVRAESASTLGSQTDRPLISELAMGRFFRELDLPMEILPSKVEATYKNGILRLVMPLEDPRKHRPIFLDVR
jgi:HSP20 family protein